MRQDSAFALQQLQDRLGDGLDAALADEFAGAGASGLGTPASEPRVDTLELRQIAGAHAGGTLRLGTGSYRLGPGAGADALAAGQPEAGRFGLTVSPSGELRLIPPPDGIRLDGRYLTEPAELLPGQVIDVGSARFQVGVSRSRNNLVAEADGAPALGNLAIEPMPASSKKRGVDPQVIDWAHRAQSMMAVRMRTGLTPDEIHRRSIIGPSAFFTSTPTTPGFGRVPIAIGTLPVELPGDKSALNKATQAALDEASIVPSVPLEMDLLMHSIAIVGNHNEARSIASWIGLCATVMSGPDYVGLTILARTSRGDWSWCDALPHSEPAPGRALDVFINDRQTDLPQLPNHGVISLVDQPEDVPAGCHFILELGRQGATLTDVGNGRVASDVTPIGVSGVFALDVTFSMADHFIQQSGDLR